jgi:hypothetical protein
VETSLVITTLNLTASSRARTSNHLRDDTEPTPNTTAYTQHRHNGRVSPQLPLQRTPLLRVALCCAPKSKILLGGEKPEWPHFLLPQSIADHEDPTAGFTAKTVFPTIRNCSSKVPRSMSDNGIRYVSVPPFHSLPVREQNG